MELAEKHKLKLDTSCFDSDIEYQEYFDDTLTRALADYESEDNIYLDFYNGDMEVEEFLDNLTRCVFSLIKDTDITYKFIFPDSDWETSAVEIEIECKGKILKYPIDGLKKWSEISKPIISVLDRIIYDLTGNKLICAQGEVAFVFYCVSAETYQSYQNIRSQLPSLAAEYMGL